MYGTWKRCCALTGVAVGLLWGTCLAAVGNLEYAASPPAFGRGVFVSLGPPKRIEQADKLRQLGAAEAFVVEGTARSSRTSLGIKVAAAVIRTKADAEEWDAIRVDLTGKGDFRNAPKMALETDRNASSYYTYYASLEPGRAAVSSGGRDIPVTVTGYHYVARGTRAIGLTLQAAVEGTCAFGKEIRKVRILDSTGDLRFGGAAASPKIPTSPKRSSSRVDRFGTAAASSRRYALRLEPERTSQLLTPLARRAPVPPGLRGADRVQVADEKGRFDHVKIAGGTLLGSPVQVGRKWFLVRVADMKISAEPLGAPMGGIAGIAGNWQVHLTGKKYAIIVNGAAKAVPVPADKYRVTRCVYFRPDQRGRAVPAVKSYHYPARPLEVAEGETAKVEMGLPVKATMVAKVSAGKVTFSVKRVDTAGRRILRVMNAAGQRPKAPPHEDVDKTGTVVYTAQLEYG